jgi:hypothetical protein
MPKKTARIKPVRKERRPVSKPAHKEKKPELSDDVRELLEHAARFLLVRDQVSADALRAGLIAHHIIKE